MIIIEILENTSCLLRHYNFPDLHTHAFFKNWRASCVYQHAVQEAQSCARAQSERQL